MMVSWLRAPAADKPQKENSAAAATETRSQWPGWNAVNAVKEFAGNGMRDVSDSLHSNRGGYDDSTSANDEDAIYRDILKLGGDVEVHDEDDMFNDSCMLDQSLNAYGTRRDPEKLVDKTSLHSLGRHSIGKHSIANSVANSYALDMSENNDSVYSMAQDDTEFTEVEDDLDMHVLGCNDDFFADSPYFNAFIEKEAYSLMLLTKSTVEIAKKTRLVGKSGSRMASDLRLLAESCRIGPENSPEAIRARREALGPEMADSLERLGNVLDEVAYAQEKMCRVFEMSIAVHLETFAANESKTVDMKQEAVKLTGEAEQLWCKYLSGKNGVGGNIYDSAAGTTSSRRKSIGGNIKSPDKNDGHIDPVFNKALQITNWQHNIELVRKKEALAQHTRFKLSKRIVDTKYAHQCELSSNARRLLDAMGKFFENCEDAVSETLPSLKKREHEAKKDREAYELRDVPVWKKRDKKFVATIDNTKKSEKEAKRRCRKLLPENSSIWRDAEFLDTKKIQKSELEMWEMPKILAACTSYKRTKAPGVLVEGWLYQKATSNINILSSSPVFNRAWFVLKNEGIFCFQSSNELRREQKNNSTVKIKVCDVELCTVRELGSDGGTSGGDCNIGGGKTDSFYDDPTKSRRFCFEIIVPKYTKPIVLQAKGPDELRMWVDGIRSAISHQLAVGDFNSKMDETRTGAGNRFYSQKKTFAFNSQNTSERGVLGIGRDNSKMIRQSSEIRITVLENQTSLKGGLSKNAKEARAAAGIGDIKEECDSEDSSSNDKSNKKSAMKQIMEANPICADCDKKGPDWASLNLGVLMCLECSGVHRSLGVHVSKVRSLTLDSLSERESWLLLSLGNDRVNQFLEKELIERSQGSTMIKKPCCATADRKSREEYIKSKYVDRKFVGNAPSRQQSCESLYEAAKKGDVVNAMKALVQGGRVDWQNEKEGYKTALHVCGVELGDVEDRVQKSACVAEFLLQNGAKFELSGTAHSESSMLSDAPTNSAHSMIPSVISEETSENSDDSDYE